MYEYFLIIWVLPTLPTFKNPIMCHGQGCRVLLGMGDLPPLMTESLFHGSL